MKFSTIIQEMGLRDWNAFQIQVAQELADKLKTNVHKIILSKRFPSIFAQAVDRNKNLNDLDKRIIVNKIIQIIKNKREKLYDHFKSTF